MDSEKIEMDLCIVEAGSFKTPCHPCFVGTEYDDSVKSTITTASTHPIPTDIRPISQEKMYIDGLSTQQFINEFIAEMLKPMLNYFPDRIIKSGPATIVFWKDGTKTIVKRAADEPDNDFNAFTAALAKKALGSTNAVRKVVKTKTEVQKLKDDKD